jgi:sec-independent protein translocase protein TatA
VVTAEILGPDLLIVVILAVVLLFGADRLPKLARGLGEASRELKKAQEDPAPPAPGPEPEGKTVTLTRAELDALLAERAALRQPREPPGPPQETGPGPA